MLTIDTKLKKRKLNEPSLLKGPPPLKKPALGTSSSLKPVVVKKEIKPTTPAVKDAKSDSSFFSAPKPKPKLPNFKKAPVAPVPIKRETANVAQPSSFDPFQEALKSMGKARKESPSVPTPPSAAGTPPQPNLVKNGKKKKTVTWAPQAQLESIRLIEKAIYDDDPVDVSSLFPFVAFVRYINDFPLHFLRLSKQGLHMSHSIRDLDRGEGAALHAHIFEETVDWSEPIRKQIITLCSQGLYNLNHEQSSTSR